MQINLLSVDFIEFQRRKKELIRMNDFSINEIRQHLVEELADVLMYYNDVLLCYGIAEEELKKVYVEKFEKNMKRW